ncbi:MAG: PAS domain-containing protein [Verrucomicrobiales bacterium]|nr:PAS domain-containing protein [Verrucomicrobiales bacterium]
MKLRRTKKSQSAASLPEILPTQPPSAKDAPLVVVGIGASAGGLEALEQFFKGVPPESGLAFVVVQHLDPTRKGIMAELLQRGTSMPVVQVKDHTRVHSDCVYIIPPNKDLSLLHNVLHLLPPTGARGLRLPIDFFFRSLAQDQQDRSVGVILSGMGSDGTLGLRAIKERRGLVVVQTPANAKFDGMPRSAVDTGLADIVAPAEELAGKILTAVNQGLSSPGLDSPESEPLHGSLQKVVTLLRARSGHDFSLYKRNTLYRRIERRMGIHQIDKISVYIRYLQENSQELDLLFKELLIGVTQFFRDPEAWRILAQQALPELLAGRSSSHPLRAWVAGCSTGEEAYSLAMIFREALDDIKPKGNLTLQIFATDLDRDAIDKARRGTFPATIASQVSAARLTRFFSKEEQSYRVRKEIREMVIYAPQNLIMDPPFTKLDILICRNLLIYLSPELQKRLIPLFHYNLNPGGLLFLGSSETVGSSSELFAPVSTKVRIYRRNASVIRPEPLSFPSPLSTASIPSASAVQSPLSPPNLQSLADQLILQRYAPPATLVNTKGDILYVSGRTGSYLEPAAGKANWNIFAMAREGLRYELASAFQRALREPGPVPFRGSLAGEKEDHRSIEGTVERMEDPGPLQGALMIIFRDLPTTALTVRPSHPSKSIRHQAKVAELERELHEARENLRILRDDRQSSQEELTSANEELQSTNEELQSTNEELTTSKEEMQSLNEELQSVNAELQSKVDDLSRASDDMKNLLNSTDIATLFLDRDLHIRRFTPQTAKIIKLIPSDIGRPITDLASELEYPQLAADGHSVIDSLVAQEKPISCKDGRWFTVRIMPYRTLDDRIDGVVITFADISASRATARKQKADHAILAKRYAKHVGKLAEKARSRRASGAPPKSSPNAETIIPSGPPRKRSRS